MLSTAFPSLQSTWTRSMPEQEKVGQTIEERELLAKAQRGEMSAFEKLVEGHRDNVYCLGLRIARSEADAAEIALESFLSAHAHLKDFKNEAEFSAYVYRFATNRARTRAGHRREQGVEKELELQPNEGVSLAGYPAADWSGSAATPLAADLRRAIEHAADRLPQSQREMIMLRDVAGLSYQQIADISGDSIPEIKGRLH